jgi:hypothetical protein
VKAFSDPTIGLIVRLADKPTRSQLRNLLMRADLMQFQPPRLVGATKLPTKADWLTDYLITANKAAGRDNATARKGLLDFACLLVEELLPYMDHMRKLLNELRCALLADGYELLLPVTPLDTVALLPTEPSAAPLPTEITALEAELDNRGYDIALNHYRQAVSNLLDQKYEAANAALRTSLEDLVTRLATDHDGFQPGLGSNGQPKANQGGQAIAHLVDTTMRIPADDGGMMLRGLWKMSCTNGSHPGRSNADEARSRLQLVTATARIVLGYFPV